MKLNRLLMASAICLTLSAPSAFACEHSGGGWLSFFHHSDHEDTSQTGPDKQNGRQASQDGEKRTGNNCDRGKGNGYGYCGTGGSTSGGGSSSGGGTSTGGNSSSGGTIYK